jgi:hypothetical protein
MKNIFGFVLWQWRKYEIWQKLFVFSMFVFGIGLGSEGQLRVILTAAPMMIIFSYLVKWFVWDALKDSYNRYIEEKQKIIDVIKNSN